MINLRNKIDKIQESYDKNILIINQEKTKVVEKSHTMKFTKIKYILKSLYGPLKKQNNKNLILVTQTSHNQNR